MQFVAESQNPKNIKGVKKITVYCQSSLLKDGLILVDTPGVGSVHKHNTDSAEDFLPWVDTVIFVLSPDPPIGQIELEFLRIAKPYSSKFFFVVTKSDLYDADTLAASKEYTRAVIEAAGIAVDDLYTVSAKQGQDTGDLVKLTEHIKRFVNLEGVEVLTASNTKRLVAILADLANGLRIEAQTLLSPVHEMETKAKAFHRLKDKLSRDQHSLSFLAQGEVERILAEVDAKNSIFVPQVKQQITEVLVARSVALQGLHLKEFKSALEQLMLDELTQALDKHKNDLENILQPMFIESAERLNSFANQATEVFLQEVASVFDVKLDFRPISHELSQESHMYFCFWEQESYLSFRLSPLTSVLPAKWFYTGVLTSVVKSLNKLIERNAGRIRSDFWQRVSSTIRAIVVDLKSQMGMSAEVIDRAYAHSRQWLSAEANEREQYAHEIGEVLQRVKEQLSNLQNKWLTHR